MFLNNYLCYNTVTARDLHNQRFQADKSNKSWKSSLRRSPLKNRLIAISTLISSANRVNYHFNKGFGLFRAPYFEQLSCNQDFYIDKEELICIQYPAM